MPAGPVKVVGGLERPAPGGEDCGGDGGAALEGELSLFRNGCREHFLCCFLCSARMLPIDIYAYMRKGTDFHNRPLNHVSQLHFLVFLPEFLVS